MKMLLILVVTIGIAAVLATVLVGTSTFEGTVVSNPYESGLNWDAQQQARAASGWSVSPSSRSFRQGTSAFSVTVTDRSGSPVSGAAVILRISYPSTSRYDREYVLAREQNGRYGGTIDLPRGGQWNLQIAVQRGEQRALFDDSIRAE